MVGSNFERDGGGRGGVGIELGLSCKVGSVVCILMALLMMKRMV